MVVKDCRALTCVAPLYVCICMYRYMFSLYPSEGAGAEETFHVLSNALTSVSSRRDTSSSHDRPYISSTCDAAASPFLTSRVCHVLTSRIPSRLTVCVGILPTFKFVRGVFYITRSSLDRVDVCVRMVGRADTRKRITDSRSEN